VADEPANVLGDGAGVESSVLWRFATGIDADLAAYAGRFDAPFWADFAVDGQTRTITLPPDGPTLTETVSHESDSGYSYHAAGAPGISDYVGSFAVIGDSVATELSWTTAFHAADPAALGRMLAINAAAAAAMGSKLADRFPPADGSPGPSS
jgi:hypothetical protein